jgi:hypothetical protein
VSLSNQKHAAPTHATFTAPQYIPACNPSSPWLLSYHTLSYHTPPPPKKQKKQQPHLRWSSGEVVDESHSLEAGSHNLGQRALHIVLRAAGGAAARGGGLDAWEGP